MSYSFAQEFNAWRADPLKPTWKVTSQDRRQQDPAVTCEYEVVGVNIDRTSPDPKAVNGVYGTDPDGNVWLIPMGRRDLMGEFYDFREAVPKKDRWVPTPFTDLIFLGSGVYSLREVAELHRHVAWVVMMNGGLQQPPMSTDPEPTPEDQAWEDKLVAERDAVLRGIVLALMGKKMLKDP